jgi:hypothetical protein
MRTPLIAVLTLFVVLPVTADAQWRWLDKQSGPGPYIGATGEFKLVCRYNAVIDPAADADRLKRLGGVTFSIPCLKKIGSAPGPDVAETPGAQNRQWAFGLATGFALSTNNNLQYEPEPEDSRETRILNLPLELYGDRRWNRWEYGAFAGVHLFRGQLFGDTVIPNTWKSVLGVRGTFTLFYLGAPPSLASVKLRGGVVWYPGGFDVGDFGATGNWPERREPSSGREVIPFFALVLDLDRWR